LNLTAEEQVEATYTAYFGRAPDKDGFDFWVNLFHQNQGSLTPVDLLSKIAGSFSISDEAKGIYPVLANPLEANDLQIGSFLNGVYQNLFNRAPDAAGLTYWTNRIHDAIQNNGSVGAIIVNIISGAQNSASGQDITTLMNKVAVGLEYVHQQGQLGTSWSFAQDGANATALTHSITADPNTLLLGIHQADSLVSADLHH
jgi:hypothetical protein